jgi:hypothetical protein
MAAPRKPARRKPRVNPSKYTVKDDIFAKGMTAAERNRMVNAGIKAASARRTSKMGPEAPRSDRGGYAPKATVRRPEGVPYATQRSSPANSAMANIFNNGPKLPSSVKRVPSAASRAATAKTKKPGYTKE